MVGVIVAALYLAMFLGPSATPKLGLDLRGGTQVILVATPLHGKKVTQGALDQAVSQVGPLVGAYGIGGVEGVLRAAVDGERAPGALHLEDVLLLDVLDGADLDPAVSAAVPIHPAHASNTALCISGRNGCAAGGNSRRT